MFELLVESPKNVYEYLIITKKIDFLENFCLKTIYIKKTHTEGMF